MSSVFIGGSCVVKPEGKALLDQVQKEEEYFLLRET